MIIQSRHINPLEDARQASFERKAFLHFKKDRPEESGDAALKDAIHSHTEEAFTFRISNEDDVVRFIELRMYLADKWAAPEFQWVHEYLHEWSSASLRIQHVVERLRFGGERTK